MSVNVTELIKLALKAREAAYCPYSGFSVGACVMSESGSYYAGCNIENASYGATNCAERTAIFKAVSEGETKILAIAIAGGPAGSPPLDYAYPCGICRQVMSEFSDPHELVVIVAKSETDYRSFSLSELLPHSFTAENL